MNKNRIRNIAFSLDLFLSSETGVLTEIRKKGPDAKSVPRKEVLQLVADRQSEDVQCVLVGAARQYIKVVTAGEPDQMLTLWLRAKGVMRRNTFSEGALVFEDDVMDALDLLEVDTFITADEILAKRAVNNGIERVYLLKLDHEGGRMSDDPRILVYDDSQLLSGEIHGLTISTAHTTQSAAA